jgi:hypothetical protein
MKTFHCSPATPWGIHLAVRNDEECTRCGWTAPGPLSDARADRREAAGALASAHGWTLIEGGARPAPAAEPLRKGRAAA